MSKSFCYTNPTEFRNYYCPELGGHWGWNELTKWSLTLQEVFGELGLGKALGMVI